MGKGKQLRNSSGINITISDFMEEVGQEDLDSSIKWGGEEIAANPELAQKLSELLLGNNQLTHIVLGISAVSKNPPEHVHTSIATGFMMGVALVLELLNKIEDPDGGNAIISTGNQTIQ